MKAYHNRNICLAGLESSEIAEIVYNLIKRYGNKIIDLSIDCDGLYFTTTEYIK